MSWLSNPGGTLLKMLTAMEMHLSQSSIDPQTKEHIQGTIDSAKADIKVAGSAIDTAVSETVKPVEVPLAENVANVAGQAVEQMADTAIETVAAPLAPTLVPFANAMLEAVGGNLMVLIGHLLHHAGTLPEGAVAKVVIPVPPQPASPPPQ